MKAAELKGKSIAELQKELHDLLREQFNLRMQNSTSQLKRNHQMGNVRRSIARVKTILTQVQQA